MVANCDVCQKFRNKQSYEPLMKHDIPSEPWNKVAADLFSLGNNNYMILTDYTGKYFEVCEIPDQTSTSVIKCIKRIFSRFGSPKVLISDNGPCFASYEFKHFLNSWDVKHRTSSPLYPRSNGLVERMIQTVKKTIKKCIEGNEVNPEHINNNVRPVVERDDAVVITRSGREVHRPWYLNDYAT